MTPKSLIRDVANQNKWVEEPPNGIEREKTVEVNYARQRIKW